MIITIILFFFIVIPRQISSIECTYSDQPFEYHLDQFNDEDFREKLNSYPSYDYLDDNSVMCHVEIYIDYQTRQIIISFADSFDWWQLDEGEGRLDFLIMFTPEYIGGEFYNVLEYACFNQDQCDRNFVFNQIQWLRMANYTAFQSQLTTKLLNNSSKTEKCFIDQRNTQNCSNGICLSKYSHYHKSYFFECLQNPGAVIEVHITTNMIVEEDSPNDYHVEQNQIVRYTCKFDQCNSQAFTDSLVKIVDSWFSIAGMRDGFLALYQPEKPTTFIESNQTISHSSTEDSSSTRMTSTTRRPPSNTARKSFYWTINLFFIYFFSSFYLMTCAFN